MSVRIAYIVFLHLSILHCLVSIFFLFYQVILIVFRSLLFVTEFKIIREKFYIAPDAIAVLQFLPIYVIYQLLYQLLCDSVWTLVVCKLHTM